MRARQGRPLCRHGTFVRCLPVDAPCVVVLTYTSRRPVMLAFASCREWRELLTGAPLDVTFPASVTPAQTEWLLSTSLPVRSISFPAEVTGGELDHACRLLATDARALAQMATSLRAAHNIVIPRFDFPGKAPATLHRFQALDDVTLLSNCGSFTAPLAKLPPSVRRLTMLGDPGLQSESNLDLKVSPPRLSCTLIISLANGHHLCEACKPPVVFLNSCGAHPWFHSLSCSLMAFATKVVSRERHLLHSKMSAFCSAL